MIQGFITILTINIVTGGAAEPGPSDHGAGHRLPEGNIEKL